MLCTKCVVSAAIRGYIGTNFNTTEFMPDFLKIGGRSADTAKRFIILVRLPTRRLSTKKCRAFLGTVRYAMRKLLELCNNNSHEEHIVLPVPRKGYTRREYHRRLKLSEVQVSWMGWSYYRRRELTKTNVWLTRNIPVATTQLSLGLWKY